jgi:uncharacterized protein (TIGR03083 family)
VSIERIRSSISNAGADIASRLTSAPGDRHVAGLRWTVGELGAHLVSEAQRFTRFARGEDRPLDRPMAEINAVEMDEVGTLEPAKLAELLERSNVEFLDATAGASGADRFVWFDVPMTVAEASGIYLGELLVHGHDLATTLGQPWEIDRADALDVIRGVLRIIDRFVDAEAAAEFTGTFRVRPRGGEAVTLSFDRGALHVTREGLRPDCTISADPATFLLVGDGRASQWGAIARGKLLAYGRRPWLALRFTRLLRNP